MNHRHVIFLILAVLLSSCGGGAASDSEGSSPVVLTSTTFLADITRNVAGDRVQVGSLLPVGVDPHSYQPTPRDAATISQSELLILNGLEYEEFIESLLENAGGSRTIVTASDGIPPREMEEHENEEEDQGHEAGDPHMWLDPNLVIIYVENIREGLVHFDPDGATVYQSNADAYTSQLKDLDAWIVEQVNQIPVEKRLLVTNHEALGYFAKQYGFTVVGTVIETFSSNASPSAQQLAELIEQIRSSGAPAIFLDTSDSPIFAQQIADETGARVVTDLHLESLTKGPPAPTYIDMMKHNVTQIVNALR
jgi:ABC-type Zn uptake system ZnuABC Zn-binding protein ZnuA